MRKIEKVIESAETEVINEIKKDYYGGFTTLPFFKRRGLPLRNRNGKPVVDDHKIPQTWEADTKIPLIGGYEVDLYLTKTFLEDILGTNLLVVIKIPSRANQIIGRSPLESSPTDVRVISYSDHKSDKSSIAIFRFSTITIPDPLLDTIEGEGVLLKIVRR